MIETVRHWLIGFATYLVEARREVQKVNWPSRSAVVRMTIAVLLFSTVVALVLGGFDMLFDRAILWLVALQG